MALDDLEIAADELRVRRELPPAVAGNRLKRLDPQGAKRAPERLTALKPAHKLLAQYMVYGVENEALAKKLRVEPCKPMTLIQAADLLRIRRRAARRLALDPLFRTHLASQIAAWRTQRAGDAMRVIDGIMNDPGEGSAADRKVQLEAAKVMAGEHIAPPNGAAQAPANVTVQAGIVIKLKHADAPGAVVEAVGARVALRQDATGAQFAGMEEDDQ